VIRRVGRACASRCQALLDALALALLGLGAALRRVAHRAPHVGERDRAVPCRGSHPIGPTVISPPAISSHHRQVSDVGAAHVFTAHLAHMQATLGHAEHAIALSVLPEEEHRPLAGGDARRTVNVLGDAARRAAGDADGDALRVVAEQGLLDLDVDLGPDAERLAFEDRVDAADPAEHRQSALVRELGDAGLEYDGCVGQSAGSGDHEDRGPLADYRDSVDYRDSADQRDSADYRDSADQRDSANHGESRAEGSKSGAESHPRHRTAPYRARCATRLRGAGCPRGCGAGGRVRPVTARAPGRAQTYGGCGNAGE